MIKSTGHVYARHAELDSACVVVLFMLDYLLHASMHGKSRDNCRVSVSVSKHREDFIARILLVLDPDEHTGQDVDADGRRRRQHQQVSRAVVRPPRRPPRDGYPQGHLPARPRALRRRLHVVARRRVAATGASRHAAAAPLAMGSDLCGPDGSSIFQTPPKAAKKWFLGSHDGGWVVATDFSELTVVNLFSGDELPLSPKQKMIFSRRYPWPTLEERENNLQKIIFSQDPTSLNGCILAGIKKDQSHITLCRVGCMKGELSTYRWHGEKISDIVFCNGELYGLTEPNESLIKFEIGMKEDDTPMITAAHQLAIQSPSRANNPPSQARYIFELHGKPSMAVMAS